MNQEIRNDLHDEAVDLAFRHFEDPTDEHIECIRARLEYNYWSGLGNEGAVTVH